MGREWEEEEVRDVEWNTNATARVSIPANTPAGFVKDDFCRFGLYREAWPPLSQPRRQLH